MKTTICTAVGAALLLTAGPATARGFGIDPMGVNGGASCSGEEGGMMDPDGCPVTIDEGSAINPDGATANAEQGGAMDPNGGWIDSFGAWFAGLFS